jgi:hypothetical protein
MPTMNQTGILGTKRGRVRLLFWVMMGIFAVEILFFAVT